LIDACFISSRFSDHAIPSIERGISKKDIPMAIGISGYV
jgi:hypothetical protein